MERTANTYNAYSSLGQLVLPFQQSTQRLSSLRLFAIKTILSPLWEVSLQNTIEWNFLNKTESGWCLTWMGEEYFLTQRLCHLQQMPYSPRSQLLWAQNAGVEIKVSEAFSSSVAPHWIKPYLPVQMSVQKLQSRRRQHTQWERNCTPGLSIRIHQSYPVIQKQTPLHLRFLSWKLWFMTMTPDWEAYLHSSEDLQKTSMSTFGPREEMTRS